MEKAFSEATPHINYPPFSYGSPANKATNTFPMFPQNATPALVVWLFLTTSQDFLDALDSLPMTDPALVDAADVAKATNLKPATVNEIFDLYRNGSPQFRALCTGMASAFKDFSVNPGGYDISNCPNGPSGDGQYLMGKTVLMDLATSGARVNPRILSVQS